MKRKLISFILGVAIAVSALPMHIFANDEIKILLNLEPVEFDQPPLIENGRTLVPFRAILEAMGITVNWNAEEKTITCAKDEKIVSLTIGSNKMIVNDSPVLLDVSPKVVNGRTLVPLRAVSESFNANVDWSSETKTVSIATNLLPLNEITPEFEQEILNSQTSIKQIEITDDNSNVLIIASVEPENFKLSEKAQKIVDKTVPTPEEFLNESLDLCGYKGENGLDELKSEAKEMLEIRGKDFEPLEFMQNYNAFEKDKFVSVIKTTSFYLGGAHPSTLLTAKTYNIETGEEVTLKDVSETLFGKSEEEAFSAIKNTYLEKINSEPGAYFEDAAKTVNEIDGANFYITNNGELVYFFNQYDIAPYASGIFEEKINF